MNIEVKHKDDKKALLDVLVGEALTEKALDFAYKKAVKNIEIKGFRKGKIPRFVFEKRFGIKSLFEEALKFLYPLVYKAIVEDKILKESGIVPFIPLNIKLEENYEKEKTFLLHVEVFLEPKVTTLADYKNIGLNEEELKVTDEKVAEELLKLQEKLATYKIVEDAETENNEVAYGDIVVLNFKFYLKDEESFSIEDIEIHVSENSREGKIFKDLFPNIIGMFKGKENTVELFSIDIFKRYLTVDKIKALEEELANKKVVRVSFVVKELRKRQLPVLDDSFAQDVGEYESLASLKEEITRNLEKKLKEKAFDKFIESICKESVVEISEEVLNFRVSLLLKELVFLPKNGKEFTEEERKEIMSLLVADAKKRLKIYAVINAIIKNEKINLEEEVKKEEERLTKEGIKYDRNELIWSMYRNKVADLLVSYNSART